MQINRTTKAPIVNHFAETIAGGSTIRAFNKEPEFATENLCLIDANASPFFHSFGGIEWLILRLQFLSTMVVVASALFIVLLPEGHIDPGFAGLALSYGLSLNLNIVNCVQNQCNLSNTIISVERIKQYMHLESEAPVVINDKRPSAHWPSIGKVVLENLEVRYRPNAPLVLRGITCTFEGGQRVGVVGRTGSRKTTLISSLFRLVEPASGRITIDGIDISTIGLQDLRSRLGIIPQEPTLFRGTVWFNLDPLDEHSDAEVWEALDQCQLGDIMRAKPERLDAPGRALLKRSGVLVLDEASASIDNSTDAILQRILRREFSDCTVVTVAHRIPTAIDSDVVLALHDGKMAEFDQTKKLLEDSSSLFARLVAEYWANAHH